jgi:hypothetical protein
VIILFTVIYQHPELRQPITAIFDTRPAKRVLFIGNSHTFYHDMPRMVGEIADSAQSPVRFATQQHAIGGARFRDHWNNQDVQLLLKQPWDYVIFQGGSNETTYAQSVGDFHAFGRKLIKAAKATGAHVALYVTWPYRDDYEDMRRYPVLKETMAIDIQKNYRQLAADTGATLVNIGERWQMLRRYEPGMPLYEDGNHATVQGSYLVALMFYGHLSQASLSGVRYIPQGVTPIQAAILIRYANR